MKIAAFSVRPDEKQYFDTFANVYKVELQINRSGFTADDIESVKGCEAMSCLLYTSLSSRREKFWR